MNSLPEKLKNDVKFKRYIKNFFNAKMINYNSEAVLEVELTNRCNVRCLYCGIYSGKKIYNIDFHILVKFINDFVKYSKDSGFETASVSLSGGDPLLYPDFIKLIKFLKNNRIPYGIKANPSTVTPEHIDILRENLCSMVKMTFVGEDSIYQKYRKGDSFPLLSEKTKLIIKKGIPVIWHFTVGRFNFENLIESLPEVNRIKPSAVSLGRIADIGKKGIPLSDIHLPPEKYKEFLKSLLVFFYQNHRYGFNLMFKEKLWIPLLVELGLLDLEDLPKNKISLGCDAYNRLMTITYEGNILACGLIPSITFGSVYNGNSISNLDNTRPISTQDKSVCHSCKFGLYCRGCRGIALANTGSLYNKDPQCWLEDP